MVECKDRLCRKCEEMQGRWIKEPVNDSRKGEEVSTGVLNSDCFSPSVMMEDKYIIMFDLCLKSCNLSGHECFQRTFCPEYGGNMAAATC
jgi:hypothetical protein